MARIGDRRMGTHMDGGRTHDQRGGIDKRDGEFSKVGDAEVELVYGYVPFNERLHQVVDHHSRAAVH